VTGLRRAEVEQRVRAALPQLQSDAADEELRSPPELEELTRWPGMAALVRNILSDEDWLEAVAGASFRHVLGFDKFVLVSARPAGQMRVHVWWPDETRVREDVHNHRFDFVSFVLVGQMRTRLYRPSDEGLPHQRFQESALPTEHRWTLSEAGQKRLGTELVADFGAGTCYRLGTEALHRVEARAGLVVTLVFELESTKQKSSVFVAESASRPDSVPQGRFTVDDTRTKLERLLELLPEAPVFSSVLPSSAG
jgi:hypothetical protein